jgi:GntR family transcriptional repressor for pyruvate dehydrogenase complex
MKRALLYENVVDAIKSDLLQGKLQPGDRLPTITEVSQKLGINQTAVREAYRILQQMNVLEVVQGRGTFVTDTIHKDGSSTPVFKIQEQPSRLHLLEARKQLEPGIAALAASRATEAEANAIRRAAQQAEENPPIADEWPAINIRFHDLIVGAAHNPVLAQMLTSIRELIVISQPLAPQDQAARARAIQHHTLIAMAIAQRNAEAARALMHQHIESFEQDLLSSKRGEGTS